MVSRTRELITVTEHCETDNVFPLLLDAIASGELVMKAATESEFLDPLFFETIKPS